MRLNQHGSNNTRQNVNLYSGTVKSHLVFKTLMRFTNNRYFNLGMQSNKQEKTIL